MFSVDEVIKRYGRRGDSGEVIISNIGWGVQVIVYGEYGEPRVVIACYQQLRKRCGLPEWLFSHSPVCLRLMKDAKEWQWAELRRSGGSSSEGAQRKQEIAKWESEITFER